MSTSFEFNKLLKLLARSENDPEVRNFFGEKMSNIQRDEYYGSLEFKPQGVDVVFQEAPWVLSSEKVTDPKELYLAAFHLHRDGHEGYAGYSNNLPNGLVLGESEADVLRKMGKPIKIGGGCTSRLFKGPVPRWFWFSLGDAIFHIQFDHNGRVDMATLQTPEVKVS
jgi:hypothetical protein